jgi:hypothetical protein
MSNYIRTPCISKLYGPQLALCHLRLLWLPLGYALVQSNALVPQSQFHAVKPYFTGSTFIVSTFPTPITSPTPTFLATPESDPVFHNKSHSARPYSRPLGPCPGDVSITTRTNANGWIFLWSVGCWSSSWVVSGKVMQGYVYHTCSVQMWQSSPWHLLSVFVLRHRFNISPAAQSESTELLSLWRTSNMGKCTHDLQSILGERMGFLIM